jgi:hypothetical protein
MGDAAVSDAIPYDDTTKPDEVVVNLIRAERKRQLTRLNEQDLLRALARIRPEKVERYRREAFGPITPETRAEDRSRIAEQAARDEGKASGLF